MTDNIVLPNTLSIERVSRGSASAPAMVEQHHSYTYKPTTTALQGQRVQYRRCVKREPGRTADLVAMTGTCVPNHRSFKYMTTTYWTVVSTEALRNGKAVLQGTADVIALAAVAKYRLWAGRSCNTAMAPSHQPSSSAIFALVARSRMCCSALIVILFLSTVYA